MARGGDWIDAGAAKATGSTQSRMCALKEQGVDLLNPESREQEALVLYYKALIEYCIDQTAREFAKIKDPLLTPEGYSHRRERRYEPRRELLALL